MEKDYSMNELPLISVIVPVYRVESYLNKCVQSIAGQTYRNLEILLVDDGSPDDSGAICDAWAAKDSRIRVIHKENGGGGAARNTALDAASGELIAFVDSDDYIAPDMYDHLYGLLRDGADIAECDFVITPDDGAEFAVAEPQITVYNREEAMREHIQDTVFRQLIWNKLYRREMIGGIRFPVGTAIDDEFFTYQVLGNAKKLVRSTKVCYAYRQQPGSIMHQTYSLKRLEGIRAKQLRLQYLKESMPSLVYEAETALFFFCIDAMQKSLRYLSGEELETARRMIHGVVDELKPLKPSRKHSLKGNIRLVLAQIFFEGVCRLQNYLETRN